MLRSLDHAGVRRGRRPRLRAQLAQPAAGRAQGVGVDRRTDRRDDGTDRGADDRAGDAEERRRERRGDRCERAGSDLCRAEPQPGVGVASSVVWAVVADVMKAWVSGVGMAAAVGPAARQRASTDAAVLGVAAP